MNQITIPSGCRLLRSGESVKPTDLYIEYSTYGYTPRRVRDTNFWGVDLIYGLSPLGSPSLTHWVIVRDENMTTKAQKLNEKINAIPDVCAAGKNAIRALIEEVTGENLSAPTATYAVGQTWRVRQR